MPQSPSSPPGSDDEASRNEESVLRYVPEPEPQDQETAERIAYDLGIEALRAQFYELTLMQKRHIAHVIRGLFMEFGGTREAANYLIHLIFDPDIDLFFLEVEEERRREMICPGCSARIPQEDLDELMYGRGHSCGWSPYIWYARFAP
ncbi:hypothetical protein VNI00_014362 [Paramarasmius palmivorus]|uniref:Uncharacterized protein n=1 Tax=Paramarasmius palmivorus TaxID=297713 RepID=A0AAW0BVT8_9AGAR